MTQKHNSVSVFCRCGSLLCASLGCKPVVSGGKKKKLSKRRQRQSVNCNSQERLQRDDSWGGGEYNSSPERFWIHDRRFNFALGFMPMTRHASLKNSAFKTFLNQFQLNSCHICLNMRPKPQCRLTSSVYDHLENIYNTGSFSFFFGHGGVNETAQKHRHVHSILSNVFFVCFFFFKRYTHRPTEHSVPSLQRLNEHVQGKKNIKYHTLITSLKYQINI